MRSWDRPEPMPYEYTKEQGKALLADVVSFMDDHIYPERGGVPAQAEEVGPHDDPPMLDKLKAAPENGGLWNLFLPHLAPDAPGTKLSNLDYAPISEQLGKVEFASEALNCAAPDTGNMEILNRTASERVKQGVAGAAARRRDPLGVLDDRARRRPRRTPPTSGCASSATATSTSSTARKWFTSGVPRRTRCKVLIVMGKTDPDASRHLQQSMIVVPKDTAGVSDRPRRRTCSATTDRGGHPEIIYEDVASRRQPARRGGWRLRHLPGSPRPGPHPSLHAHDRRRRAGAAYMVDGAGARTFGTLVAAQGPHPGLDRRVAHRDRHGAASTCCAPPTSWTPSATRRRPPRSPASRSPCRNMALQGHRPGHPGPRRGGRHPVHAARRDVRAHAHAAHRRRPGRGAQDDDRPPRDPEVRPGVPHEPVAKPASGPEAEPQPFARP